MENKINKRSLNALKQSLEAGLKNGDSSVKEEEFEFENNEERKK